MVNFYHCFVNNCDRIIEPLNDLSTTMEMMHRNYNRMTKMLQPSQTLSEPLFQLPYCFTPIKIHQQA